MARPLKALGQIPVSVSKALEGFKHGIELDGHIYVSPAMMTLLETDFIETMRSLQIKKLQGTKGDRFRMKIRP